MTLLLINDPLKMQCKRVLDIQIRKISSISDTDQSD